MEEIITKIQQTIKDGKTRLYKHISNIGSAGVNVEINNKEFEELRINATNNNIEIIIN